MGKCTRRRRRPLASGHRQAYLPNTSALLPSHFLLASGHRQAYLPNTSALLPSHLLLASGHRHSGIDGDDAKHESTARQTPVLAGGLLDGVVLLGPALRQGGLLGPASIVTKYRGFGAIFCVKAPPSPAGGAPWTGSPGSLLGSLDLLCRPWTGLARCVCDDYISDDARSHH